RLRARRRGRGRGARRDHPAGDEPTQTRPRSRRATSSGAPAPRTLRRPHAVRRVGRAGAGSLGEWMPVTLRIVFAGSPAAAVPSLEALLAGPHEVVAVVTRDDAPLGRKRVLTPTPVADAAEAAGVPVLKANRIGAIADD